MLYDTQMQKALQFIENNLTCDISLYDISREAGFSVPHFYRLFKRLTGDTVGAYILKRKMSLAAKDLTDSKKTITSISFDYGFESHDVFTRAFKRIYGISPSKFRSVDNQQMKFTLYCTDGLYVIGMECTAKQWDSDGSIGRLWSDFLTRADEIKKAASPMVMYGICECGTWDDGQFKYMAAIGVDGAAEAPPGMIKRFVRQQKFLQAEVPDFISTPDAYTGSIKYAESMGFELDDYDEIEVYEEIFQDPAINSFKLLIPIK